MHFVWNSVLFTALGERIKQNKIVERRVKLYAACRCGTMENKKPGHDDVLVTKGLIAKYSLVLL
jgi:hypothetical protein